MLHKLKIGKLLKSAHLLFFRLVILTLPVQLGKHFWPKFSLVWGLRIDYLSPTLFVTDILILAVLISWGIEKLRIKKIKRFQALLKHLPALICISVLLIGNYLAADNKPVFFYQSAKILEFILLTLYVAKNPSSFKIISDFIFIPVVYSTLIGLGQLCKQGSLGGVFWWLGERTFNLSTPGIAKTSLDGRLFLRPYATFPHPNILASFLLVGLIIIFSRLSKKNAFPVFFLAITTIFLSFSHVNWLAGLMIILCYLYKKYRRQKKYFILYLFLIMLVIIFTFWKYPVDSYSLSRRLGLAQSAFSMIKSHLFFGVGLGNFIVQLPFFWQVNEGSRFFQPVHNIFLLVAAETGLIGLGLFIQILWLAVKRTYRIKNRLVFFSLLVIIFTGLFDHYWWTLQQSQLLFAIMMGLAWSKS
ncbi:MAG TPA: O-antigen ligase family protein [Candidatus Bathyarchaeia archaeon]|nr:O-antigen ligase family protein [Candidatus Bathyarchaeia archaeon]